MHTGWLLSLNYIYEKVITYCTCIHIQNILHNIPLVFRLEGLIFLFIAEFLQHVQFLDIEIGAYMYVCINVVFHA